MYIYKYNIDHIFSPFHFPLHLLLWSYSAIYVPVLFIFEKNFYFFVSFLLFLVLLGVEFRALGLLGRCHVLLFK
jgi:hypothetical protein